MTVEPQQLRQAAHDIRSPLQILLGLVSILKKVDLPDPLKGQADLVNLSIERLKGVADRLDELASSIVNRQRQEKGLEKVLRK